MLNKKKIAVVLPGYNCEKTLEDTYKNIPKELIDNFIYVDDESADASVNVAKRLGIDVIIRHKKNMGYGANQKTCYWAAMETGADIVVMIHPDYQYEPRLILSLIAPIAYDIFDAMIGSRILGKNPLAGGMPLYKYISNRALTFVENMFLNAKLSEYHTGYRAFNRKILENLPLGSNSDDFVFDNQMLAQILYFGFSIGEVSCPARYFPEASSINFIRSVRYGLGCLATSARYRLSKMGIYRNDIFKMPCCENSLLKRKTISDDFEIIEKK